MKVQRFEDLVAWQKARDLTTEIYRATANGAFAKDFGLRDQIRRATVSVMSNIAEGFERGSARDFHKFLIIAKASCAEVRSQLYVAMDVEYLDKTAFQSLIAKAEEVSRVVGGLKASVQSRIDS